MNYNTAHALRLVFAFVATFFAVRLLQVPDGTWPLITVFVIMAQDSTRVKVLPRMLQRVGGTLLGALCGLAAIYIEPVSIIAMVAWMAVVVFLCGYLIVNGKNVYLITIVGVTLSVVSQSPVGDLHIALWRCADVLIGSAFAITTTLIFPYKEAQ